MKFFLHLRRRSSASASSQRIDDPEKNWKFSLADIEERKYWKQYMKAYEAVPERHQHAAAPWYVVPADDKANARLIVSQIILDELRALDLQYPHPDRERVAELEALRRLLD